MSDFFFLSRHYALKNFQCVQNSNRKKWKWDVIEKPMVTCCYFLHLTLYFLLPFPQVCWFSQIPCKTSFIKTTGRHLMGGKEKTGSIFKYVALNKIQIKYMKSYLGIQTQCISRNRILQIWSFKSLPKIRITMFIKRIKIKTHSTYKIRKSLEYLINL